MWVLLPAVYQMVFTDSSGYLFRCRKTLVIKHIRRESYYFYYCQTSGLTNVILEVIEVQKLIAGSNHK